MESEDLDEIIKRFQLEIPTWKKSWIKGYLGKPDPNVIKPSLNYIINLESHSDFLAILDIDIKINYYSYYNQQQHTKSFNTKNCEFVKENYHKAIFENCKEAIKKDEHFRGLYENLSTSAINLNDYDQAIFMLNNQSEKGLLSKHAYLNLGYMFAKKGTIKKSISTYQKALEQFPEDNQLTQNYAYTLLFRDKDQSLKFAADKGLIDSDMFYVLFRKEAMKYWDFIENCRRLSFEEKPDIKACAHCIKGVDSFQRLLDKNRGKKYRKIKVDNYGNTKEDYLKQIVKSIRQDQSKLKKTHIYKRATCTLYSFEDPILSDTIVIKAGKRSFDEEIRLTYQLMDFLGKEVILPLPLETFSDNEMNYYVMQMQEGESFTKKILEKTLSPELYEQGLSVLAKIYSQMPKRQFDNVYLNSRIEEQVEELEVKSYLKDVIYDILAHDFEKSTHVFCKDAHTDNFGDKNGKIIIYDTEDKGVVPLSFDIAHYLFCIPFYSHHEKRKELIHRNYHQFSNIRGRNTQSPSEYEKEVMDVALYRCATKWQYYMQRDRLREADLVLKAGIDTARRLEGKPYRSYARGFSRYI